MMFMPGRIAGGAIGGIDANTKLLLHCDGSNGSTTFTDSSAAAHTLSVGSGSPVISTAQAKFGGASLNLPGAAIVTSADHADWTLGSGAFTFDFWLRDPGNSTVMSHLQFIPVPAPGSFVGWVLGATSSLLSFSAPDGGGGLLGAAQASVSLSAGTWYHLAYVRSGAGMKIFLNGADTSATVTTAFGTIADSNAVLSIGSSIDSPDFLDEIRLSDVARWSSNFTPPARAYN